MSSARREKRKYVSLIAKMGAGENDDLYMGLKRAVYRYNVTDLEQMRDMLTLAEAAKYKGVSIQAVHKAIRTRKLPAITILNRWLISRADLDKWQLCSYAGRKGTMKRPGRKGCRAVPIGSSD